MTNYRLTEDTRKRLEIMVRINDDFGVVETGLRLHGLGDLEETQQNDIVFDLKITSLTRDGQLLQHVRSIAEDVVDNDPSAQSPENKILWQQLKFLRETNVSWAAIN